MYEIIKDINETTKLAVENNTVYVVKKTNIENKPIIEKLMKIHNQNIVKHIGMCIINDEFYVVQEYVNGITLKQYCENNYPLDNKRIIEIVVGLCNGLQTVHNAGLVHRDITPTNIMIDNYGNPVIIDFGISRICKKNQSVDTQILGTVGFAAPEQFGFMQTSHKSDIYSLGVLINYMATLALPNEKMPDGKLFQVVKKCTELDETQRYDSVIQVAYALENNTAGSIICSIPGFRKGNGWHIVVSVIYYLFVVFVFVTFFTDYKSYKELILDILIGVFWFVVPVPIVTDFGNWVEKWDFTRKMTKSGRIAIQISLSLVSLFIASIFIIMLPN